MAATVFQKCPDELRYLNRRMRMHEVHGWYQLLLAEGWTAPGWPVAYGGMGLLPDKRMIYIEELERWGAPRLADQGLINLGPILIACGTDAQRDYHLPKILNGEHVWCQGYSEPNAGSDLASLKTFAEIDGDEFVITGQKIWTSMAMDANHMFALVRTSRSEVKQAGISFVMLKMSQPGVKVRPIVNIAGREELCEVFLDGARTHRSNLVGELNDGWNVSKTLLGFERLYSGSPQHCIVALTQLEAMLPHVELARSPAFRDRLTALQLDVLDLKTTYERFAQDIQNGAKFGSEVSMLKVWATETCQRITELMIEAAGDSGSLAGSVKFGDSGIDFLGSFYDARPLSIYGGSNQIQRNILAKRVLMLPETDRRIFRNQQGQGHG